MSKEPADRLPPEMPFQSRGNAPDRCRNPIESAASIRACSSCDSCGAAANSPRRRSVRRIQMRKIVLVHLRHCAGELEERFAGLAHLGHSRAEGCDPHLDLGALLLERRLVGARIPVISASRRCPACARAARRPLGPSALPASASSVRPGLPSAALCVLSGIRAHQPGRAGCARRQSSQSGAPRKGARSHTRSRRPECADAQWAAELLERMQGIARC